MATFTKINDFVEHLAEQEHNLGSDTLTVALSDTAPGSETNDPTADGNGILANVTQIDYTNLSSRVLTISDSSQTSGTYQLTISDLTLTSSGGSTGPFRYVYVFNDTMTTPDDGLVSLHDRGSSLTLADGESVTLDFDDANGLLQIA